MMNLSSEPLGAWAADGLLSAAEVARPGDGSVPSGAARRELVEAEFKNWSRATSGVAEADRSSKAVQLPAAPSAPLLPLQGSHSKDAP